MGWDYGRNDSRAQVVAARTASYDDEAGGHVECLKQALVGNCLWRVMERTKLNEKTFRWIGIDLLAVAEGQGWGFKAMTEGMGPVYVSCPLSFLGMVPEADPAWRARVRAYHAERKRRDRLVKELKPGMRVRLVDASIPEVEIHKTKPLCGYYQGLLYRVPRSMLGEAIAE